MTATLHPNKDTPLAALWWLFQGATFLVILFDTTGVSPLPSYSNFASWVPYALDSSFDLYFTGGTAAFDASNAQMARLPQLQIVLDYDSAVTYTHLAVVSIPAVDPGALFEDAAYPVVAFISEPSAVTLSSTQTKTYNLDLTALWG